MKRNDQTFKEMVSRITAGELTRQQAADSYGVNYGTLCVWLGRSNLNAQTARKATGIPKPLAGAALGWNVTDPNKAKVLEEATARVISGEFSVTEASEKYPDLALSTLSKRVRKERMAAGYPVQKRRTRAQLQTP